MSSSGQMYLARKIDRPKWDPKSDIAEREVPADVAVDLRTKQNSLSFWRCGDGNDLELVNVALAVTANCEHVDKVDLVWVSESDLVDDGLTLESSNGVTPIQQMRDKHVDVIKLDMVRLSRVAVRMFESRATRYRRFSQGQVKRLLADAVRSGIVTESELKDGVRAKVTECLIASESSSED